MAVTQYIGARYVPNFASPIEWNNTRTYDPLTIVTHQGNSYTSRQFVPQGVDVANDTFWALTGNYNAQIEQYRIEVQEVSNTVEEVSNTVDTLASDVLELQNNPLYGKNCVIYGDSTFMDTTSGSASLGTLLAEKSGMAVTNRAISGTQLVSGAQSLSNLMNAATAATLRGFDIIICAYGTNDWQNSYPLYENVNKSYENRLVDIAVRITELNPAIEVVFVTPMGGWRNFGNATNYNNVGATIYDYAKAIKSGCAKAGIKCITLDTLFTITSNNYTSLFYQSGTTGIYVHYSLTAKNIIADAISASYPWDNCDVHLQTPGANLFGYAMVDANNKMTNTAVASILSKVPAYTVKLTPLIQMAANNSITASVYCEDFLTILFVGHYSANVGVYIDNTLICEIKNGCPVAIHIPVAPGAHVVRLTNNDTAICYIGNLGVFSGECEYSNSWYPDSNINFNPITNTFGLRIMAGTSAYKQGLSINGTVNAALTSTTKICNLPSNFAVNNQVMFTGYYTSAGTYNYASFRVYNGGLYPNVAIPESSLISLSDVKLVTDCL